MMINAEMSDTLTKPMASEPPKVNPSLMRAANAYGAMTEQTAMTTEIVWAKLLRGILNNVKRAQAEYEAGRIDGMFNLNAKSMDVLAILTQSLEVEEEDKGDTDVKGAIYFLSKTYRETMMGLSTILSQPDVVAAFQKLQDNFRPLVEHMETLAGITLKAEVSDAPEDTDAAIANLLS